MSTTPHAKTMGNCPEDKRLWIGNLDQRISEYQLLKLLQKHGPIEKFDLLFHRSGPLAGQPRGYAFVSYANRDDAATAVEKMHNLTLGSKRITVTWANTINTEEIEKPKQEVNIPALAISKPEVKSDRKTQIEAIEAKLKLMERGQGQELVINKTVVNESPVVTQLQQNNKPTVNNSNNSKYKIGFKKHERNHRPYNRHKTKR